MILGVYCMKDSKAGWLTPSFDRNDPCAVRNFVHAMKRTDSLLNSHPRDFALYHIGEFDTESGIVSGYAVPELVFDGSSAEIEV